MMKYALVTLCVLPTLCAATEAASFPMPPGIRIRLSIDGPVFADSDGMTLYKVNTRATPGGESYDAIEVCNDRREMILREKTLEGFTVMTPNVDTRRTCAQKRPALRPKGDAQPVGRWSIIRRKDGSKQWAYDGEPLYSSIKDRTPGEINGSYAGVDRRAPNPWTIASAPLIGAPTAWIAVRKTTFGLALASRAGKTLYFSERDSVTVDPGLWQPLPAPVLAQTDRLPDWSVIQRSDGSRQWAYRGKPLYTYRYDSNANDAANRVFGDVFGATYGQRKNGWRVALLKEAPAHPANVTIRTLVDGTDLEGARATSAVRAYADANGKTLYTVNCVEDTEDRLDCDDVGDSPLYWRSFCGQEDRCAKTWRPLAAPADAKPIDGIWSVVTINPHHPWAALQKGGHGLTVWAYRGKPVFTYAYDSKPEDYYAAPGLTPPSGQMYATILPAFEIDRTP